ncbi:hypothetical protein [Streptosporangium sp. NPDC023615]|uniref:hypothetical protein n=1 Tax=Streptosporangium sp. NPDC023615 TaxID=3154794 RepID=UPI00342CE6DC
MTLPLLWLWQGDGSEYPRLAALTGVIAVQFVMIPIMLAAGAWRVAFWSRRPRPAPPGLVLGGITFAFGALVLTLATDVSRRFGGGLPEPAIRTAKACRRRLPGSRER